MTYADVDRVVRLVPLGPGVTLARALEQNVELKTIYNEDPTIRKLIDSARKVEGIARHGSTHAAGVVISKEPLTRYVPLQKVSKGNGEGGVMVQFPMEDVARIGLLKMDFLGLVQPKICRVRQRRLLKNGIISISTCIIFLLTMLKPTNYLLQEIQQAFSSWKAQACAATLRN